jgi:hypothetical protein
MSETTAADDFANVIATASLLLAVVAALFSMWYGEISDAVSMSNATGKVAREVIRRSVWKVLAGKAIPLTIACALNALVFARRAVLAALSSLSLYGKNWRYDDLKAAFLLTEVMMIALALFSSWLVIKLVGKLIDNREPAQD